MAKTDVREGTTLDKYLGLVLLLGFALRIVPILWGVPVGQFVGEYHPDEGKVLVSILDFPDVYGTTTPFPGYGTSVQYIVGLLLIPVKHAILGPTGVMNLN